LQSGLPILQLTHQPVDESNPSRPTEKYKKCDPTWPVAVAPNLVSLST